MDHLGLDSIEKSCGKCRSRGTDPYDFGNMTPCPTCRRDGIKIVVVERMQKRTDSPKEE